MGFAGSYVQLEALTDGIVELRFDAQDAKVNILSQAALLELRSAVNEVKQQAGLKGLILASAKDSFILGADITEFLPIFSGPAGVIIDYLNQAHAILRDIETLPVPTVTAINGDALGGGCEVALSTDFRVISTDARLGLPETKLGIIPGFGGSIRLPRLIGPENALEWIATGQNNNAEKALQVGAVDAVVASEQLREACLHIITQANAGKLDWQSRRQRKTGPLRLNKTEGMMAFETAKAVVFQKAGSHYPAPITAVDLIEKSAGMARDEALQMEAQYFVQLAKSDVCSCLIGLFLNSQLLKKQARAAARQAAPVERAAVLGAGIMGGGIAYQSALKGTPAVMKDISAQALALGMSEASKQLNKRIERKRLTSEQALGIMAAITPTLNMGELAGTHVIVEAVVEKAEIKTAVLAEAEQIVGDEAILTSNTSTISIDKLAQGLKRPEQFCGMHFFNPVPVMPLVEVIRGSKTSEQTIATVVTYAAAMGKTPIVVNDCPGFFVNRVLFPYLYAFNLLLRDGADFRQVDKVMERFGWPMGPAYLQDVVGIDTCCHGMGVMAEGYPDRMKTEGESAPYVLFKAERLGQKNNAGFYRYEPDKKGKPKKLDDESVDALLSTLHPDGIQKLERNEIIERMMIPMCLEVVRCLEESIVATPNEADMALVLGIGFPPFRGGALRYMDGMGLDKFCQLADKYSHLGPLYRATDKLREMAAAGKSFFN